MMIDPQTSEVKWVRCKIELPRPFVNVALHTPQYADTMGHLCCGHWTGSEWEAQDGRDLTDFPPIHWAYVDVPDYDGDDDDWKHMDVDLGHSDQEEDEDEGSVSDMPKVVPRPDPTGEAEA